MLQVYCYPKCSTCAKAIKYLDDHHISYEYHNIKECPPSFDLLIKVIENNGYDLKKYFNTSGLVYKELELKDKFSSYTFDELVEMLSKNGMLIKRPFLVNKYDVVLGFKEKEYVDFLNRIL
ncbi:MAG: Spx/MgsR family RNA polymerase-binding regulatory protein [Erysipelotrichaceae bacterium]